MTNKWRSEGNPRNRNPPPRQRDRSHSPAPPPRRPEHQSAGRGRFHRDRNDFSQRPNRKRDFSPESRRNFGRRPSISPARSPNRLPPSRSRYPGDSALSSRDSSPARFSKRRRTRSPSPSDYSDRGFDERRRYSRSRSRDRVDQRDTRPDSRRGFSPRRNSPPRSARKGPRQSASDVDTYIPERRRPASPPSRQRPRRSPSPRQRSTTPPSRRRSVTPSSRRYPSRPGSPSSRYDSPLPSRRDPRDLTPDPPVRRKPNSRTPSVVGENDPELMEGPFAARGNYGHHNPMQRGRGRGNRPYYNNRGGYGGSPVNNATPNASHQGSPNHSYHGGRGGWDGPQQHNQQYQNNQSYRQNNYHGGNQSQDDYYRSQQPPQQQHHSYQNQPQRPYRGGRGQQRGGFTQHGPDRRFSGQEYSDAPFSQRGRGGGQYQNAPWHQPRGRGGSQQVMTGPNSIRNSPGPPNRDIRDEPPSQKDEQDDFRPPRGPQADNIDRRQNDQEMAEQMSQDAQQSQKDASKFSFAFKSKPMPASPVRPKTSELSEEPRPPPTQPASDRAPPTQPRGNKFQDKRAYNHSAPSSQNHHQQFDRRQDVRDQPFRPPKGPQSQYHNHNTPDRVRPPTEPRNRSRSPPPKKIKIEAPFKPTLTPEMAASDSIYFRKPGNESVVGAGTYGKVFKAIHIFTKDEVALKKIRMEGERDGFPITAVREIKLLQNLRHKHVVALQEVMVEKNECFMVFEYMSHDLTGVINHPTFKLTSAHKKDLGRQMFEGLEFLHRRGVMHRDIKAANLLISSDGQLKYADFGLARFYTKSRKLDYTNRVITIWYRPPELLLGETQYGPAVDIWSAACVFMEMFTRKAIFPGEGGELSQLEKIYNVLGTPSSAQWPGITDLPWYELVHPAAAIHPTSGEKRRRIFEKQFEEVLSPAAMDLVQQIFSYDPAHRPDAATILEHDYFCVEEPQAQQAVELAEVGGDWHEYESKAHRKENERREKERRKEEHVKEREREKKRLKEGKGKGIDEVPAAPLPIGEEEDGGAALSDGEGSARMSMS